MLVTSYHDVAFDHKRREKAVIRVTKAIARYPHSVGIVCTGLSGILVGVSAAEKTEREFAIVRKPNEQSHGCQVEGYKLAEYVIVDDFMDSGDTIRNILTAMEKRNTATCKAIILYDGGGCYASKTFEHEGQEIPIIKCRRP